MLMIDNVELIINGYKNQRHSHKVYEDSPVTEAFYDQTDL